MRHSQNIGGHRAPSSFQVKLPLSMEIAAEDRAGEYREFRELQQYVGRAGHCRRILHTFKEEPSGTNGNWGHPV